MPATALLAPVPSPLPPRPLPAPGQCIGPECYEAVPRGRICEACYGEAARIIALRLETELVGEGLIPDSPELNEQLEVAAHGRRLIEWYQVQSPLDVFLDREEALKLRGLADVACMLLARGGYSSLKALPSRRRLTVPRTITPIRQPAVRLRVFAWLMAFLLIALWGCWTLYPTHRSAPAPAAVRTDLRWDAAAR